MLKNDSGHALENFGVKVVQIPSSDGSAIGSTSNASEGEAEATTSKNKSYSTTETSECETSPSGAKSKSSSTIPAKGCAGESTSSGDEFAYDQKEIPDVIPLE